VVSGKYPASGLQDQLKSGLHPFAPSSIQYVHCDLVAGSHGGGAAKVLTAEKEEKNKKAAVTKIKNKLVRIIFLAM
jgi:hypothetical protein